MTERFPWDDNRDADDEILAFLKQESAKMERIIRQDTRQQWVINMSLVGFNLGMMLFDVLLYAKGNGWGFGLAALVHGLSGSYASRQLWRIWRRTEQEEETR